MKLLFTFVFLFAVAYELSAISVRISIKDTTLNTFNKDFVYHAKKMRSSIHIDGVIDEEDWLGAEKATDFYRVLKYGTA